MSEARISGLTPVDIEVLDQIENGEFDVPDIPWRELDPEGWRKAILIKGGLAAGLVAGVAFFSLVAIPDDEMDIFGDAETRRSQAEVDALALAEVRELTEGMLPEELFALSYITPEVIRIGRGEGGNGLVGVYDNSGIQRYEVGQDCLSRDGKISTYNTRETPQPNLFNRDPRPPASTSADGPDRLVVTPGDPRQPVWRFVVTPEGLTPSDDATAANVATVCVANPTPVLYRVDSFGERTAINLSE